jgi:hypothetical protein
MYPSLVTIFLSPIISSERRKIIEFVRRIQWLEAVKNTNDIGFIHRFLIIFIFKTAHLIKRIRLMTRA